VTALPDTPRKVNQIRHDLDDLYELMSQVDASQTRMAGVLLRHNNRFEELQQTLDLHGGRLDRIEDNQRRMQDSQQRLEDNQHRQFERLSAQMAEILGALRGPAAANPAPESER
jgi:septal ring factor EnvC (AmiA/AmiB activator)